MNTLTVFYSLYYPENIDTSFINEYIKIYLNCKFKDLYKNINIQYVPPITIDPKKDIIQNGFFIFDTLEHTVNMLKSDFVNTDFIFMFIANGSISHKQVIYDNVDVLLINNNYINHNIKYTINTNTCDILKTHCKHYKLQKIKIFRKTLDDVFEKKYNILHY